MGERENLIETVEDFFNSSNEKIESAKILLDEEKNRDSISRSYYAAYLAARALLLFIGEEPKTHSGLITLFGQKFVKNNKVEPKYAKIISDLLNARFNSDYKPITWYSHKDADEYLKKAKEFVSKMEEIYDSLKEQPNKN